MLVEDQIPNIAESLVTAAPKTGLFALKYDDSKGKDWMKPYIGVQKSPNTPRESRAVNNAGERTEGKS